ncbi:MAG: TonB system transport protein ExbD [Aquificaceae bacterium]|nr:MAG: TonB system transport protein ExbD [Aquificaceae bacterium]
MKRFDQINVIPFIDIMLVLLAIVLTTATFISQGQIDVSLPVAESATSIEASQEKSLVISIDVKNHIYLAEKKVTLKALSATLKQLDKQTPIIFRVDKQVVFNQFVQIIDLLKVNKLKKFSIVTVEK